MALSQPELNKIDADRVCRICLCEGGELYFIYDEAPVELGANIAQILNECTRYSCERFDKMPHNMCGGCIKAARQAYSFKQRAEQSYRSLISIFGRTPPIKDNFTDICTQTEQVALLPCELCEATFLNSLDLRLHRNRQHKANSSNAAAGAAGSASEEFKCELCASQFPQLRQLRSHMVQQHHKESLVQSTRCRLCQRIFSRRDHLLRHMRSVHKEGDEGKATREQRSDAATWAHKVQATMQSGDELESAALILNEAICSIDNDDYQCNTNPISSNDEDADSNADEAKESLWLSIKPEPFVHIDEESASETSNVAERGSHEKKRRRKHKDAAKCKDEHDKSGEETAGISTEASAIKVEPLFGTGQLKIKQERQRTGSEAAEGQENDEADSEHHINVTGDQEDISDIEDTDDSADDDANDDANDDSSDDNDDEDDAEDKGEDEEDYVPPKVEIIREYLQNGPIKQRRRRRHKSEIDPENRCEICQRTFSRHCHLLRHKLSHLEKKPHSCPHCPKAFARSDHLKAHVQSLHSNKEYKCALCDAAFARADALERHKVSKHNGEGLDVNSEVKLHTCEYCTKRFSSKNYLRKHTLLHTDFLFACKNCEETFKDRQQLREHEKTHTGQRNFLCCICGDSFARNDYLRVHMRRHNGEKPYKCRFCVKAFPRATDLKVHERYHTGTKPNLCNTCGKSFHRAYNLTIHMRTHTGERPYKCDQCPKSFTQSNDLKAHIRRHTGERYKCPHCDTYFLQLYNMRNHCLSAHNKHIETRTGRLQRTGLLDESGQTHLTTVVMPPVRYQQQPQPQPTQQSPHDPLPITSATPMLHLPYSAAAAAVPATAALPAGAVGVSLVDAGVGSNSNSFGAATSTATAPFGAFNFTPVVMAHLMYNHGGSSSSQQSNATAGGGNETNK